MLVLLIGRVGNWWNPGKGWRKESLSNPQLTAYTTFGTVTEILAMLVSKTMRWELVEILQGSGGGRGEIGVGGGSVKGEAIGIAGLVFMYF